MKKMLVSMLLCVALGLGAAQAQLKIDFTVTGGAVQPGYQGYFGTDKAAATFTAQSYTAFGTTVTVQASWVANAAAGALRMIDRGTDDGMDPQDLLRDWIGTDTRTTPADPMTLTISGLPAGTYQWVSYHHDPQDQTGIFEVTVTDSLGSKTTSNIDISNGVNFKLADITKFTTTIVSDGKKNITLVFHQTSASAVVANAIFVMNGFEMTVVSTGTAMSPVPGSGATDVRAGRHGSLLEAGCQGRGPGRVPGHDVRCDRRRDDRQRGRTRAVRMRTVSTPAGWSWAAPTTGAWTKSWRTTRSSKALSGASPWRP